MRTSWCAALLLLGSSVAWAQAPASPAKKELVARVLQLQQPGIDAFARQLTEQPAAQMLQAAAGALQRVPQARREALAKELQADARKYVDEMAPQVAERATKLAPQTVGPVLEDKLSEDELRQVVAMLESPVVRKFQSLQGDMLRPLAEKLVAEMRPSIEPKIRALEQSMSKRINAALPSPPPSSAASGARR